MAKTSREVSISIRGVSGVYRIPRGTAVERIAGAWAVADTEALAKAGVGNWGVADHFVWVPDSAVDPE